MAHSMAGSEEEQTMSRFQAWGDQMNDGGPDWHEEIKKGAPLVGEDTEDTEFILDLMHQPALGQGKQRTRQWRGEGRMVKSTTICLFSGTITKAVGQAEGSKGEVLLLILRSSVLFKFFTARRHSCVSRIIISNISATTTTTTKNWRERRGPKYRPRGPSTHR